MTIVNQSATTLDEGIKNLMAGAKADYVKWSTSGGKELSGYSKEQVEQWDNKTKIKNGKKYIKIVQDTGVFCFIVKEDFKHFKKGDVLKRHKDRYSCEISTTLNLGGDEWPIYLDPTGKEGQAGIKVDLKPGDMLIYSGCELEHWREEFKGKNCGQVFLHYNKAGSKTAKENELDKRPLLGLPAWFKGSKLTNSKK